MKTPAALLFILSLSWCAGAFASLPNFSSLVEKNGSAVVNISTVQKAKNRNPYPGRPGEEVPDILRYFFGEGYRFPQQDKKSLGSGFFISKDGYILTNNHVVQGADEVVVRLQDRRELNAQVIGTDAKSDLALLKIEGKNFPAVKIGRSKDLKVGEWVLAIGSPFGFDASATKGIVSHLSRSLPSENYVPFIQTDVPINPGNSGGPLFNLSGEVVGINSQIYSRTGGFMGLSFAIPIDTAMNVVEQLKSTGHVQRGWLGVVIQEVNKDLADTFGLDKPGGALVAQVLENSPASEGGLKEGDVILGYEGREVRTSSDLPVYVGETPVDTMASLKVLRERKKITLKVRIGALPDNNIAQTGSSTGENSGPDKFGIEVAELSEEHEKRWGINLGVLVQQVLQDPALSAGIQPGDIITQVNNRNIESPEAYSKILAQLPGDKWVPVLVYRQGKPIWVPLYLPSK